MSRLDNNRMLWNRVLLADRLLRPFPYIVFACALSLAIYLRLLVVDPKAVTLFQKYFSFYGGDLFWCLVVPAAIPAIAYLVPPLWKRFVRLFAGRVRKGSPVKRYSSARAGKGRNYKDSTGRNARALLEKAIAGTIEKRVYSFIRYRIKMIVIRTLILLATVVMTVVVLQFAKTGDIMTFFFPFHFLLVLVLVVVLEMSESGFSILVEFRSSMRQLLKMANMFDAEDKWIVGREDEFISWLNDFWAEDFSGGGLRSGKGVACVFDGYPSLVYLRNNDGIMECYLMVAVWIHGYSPYNKSPRCRNNTEQIETIMRFGELRHIGGLSTLKRIDISSAGMMVKMNHYDFSPAFAMESLSRLARLARYMEGVPADLHEAPSDGISSGRRP